MSIQLPDDLAEIDRRMRRRIAPWIQRGRDLVGGKIDDARAHAEKACTDAAKGSRDGRATLAVVESSRPFLAAVARLEEIRTALAGLSRNSQAGLVRDAREACYRDSFAIWRAILDPSLWRSSDPQPTRDGIERIRGQLVNGSELFDWIGDPVGRAVADLKRACTLAATKGLDARDRFDSLDAWEATKRSELDRLVTTTLSDSDQRSHTVAAVDIMAIEKIDPDVASILGS